MTNLTVQYGDDEVAEWVGQHYLINFSALNEEQRQQWRDRFDAAHEGPETNEAFIARLMTFSKSGPLMQAFILQALDQYSRVVAAADPDQIMPGIVSPAAWHRCAVELQTELKERLT